MKTPKVALKKPAGRKPLKPYQRKVDPAHPRAMEWLRFSFGAAIGHVIASQGRTWTDVAEKCGMHKSMLTKWKSGLYETVPPDTMMRVLSEVSSLPSHQLLIIVGYLTDMTPPAWRGLIDITPKQPNKVEVNTKDKHLQAMLDAMAAVYGRDPTLTKAIDAIGIWSLRVSTQEQTSIPAKQKKVKKVGR